MQFENVCIEGLGYHLPDSMITSAELEKRLSPLYDKLKLSQGRLELMSGIRERRFWDKGVFPSDVATLAGKKAIEDSGIKTLTPNNENFPLRLLQRLGRKSPALFYAVGNLEHLNKPTMGIVGSRNVSEEGAEVAKNLSKTAVDMGYAVVSGGARGVDQLSMNAAYESNGNVIGVLADSLLKAVNNSDMRRSLLEDSNTVLITPYSPDAPFNVGNAMGRNKVIYAISFLTFVVATDEDKGGTWTGAIESLRNGFGKVAVWRGEGEGPGNAELELKGAHGFGDIGKIKQLLDEPEEIPPPLVDSSQEKLFK